MTGSRSSAAARSSELPRPVGPLSGLVIEALRQGVGLSIPRSLEIGDADPYGRDLQLALCVCYELHYRGFVGVDAEREWDPTILDFRERMHREFLDAVRLDCGIDDSSQVSAADELDDLCIERDDGGASSFLSKQGNWKQFREYFALRSIYQLKEADPHAWVIPRLSGGPKAAVVAVEFDEYGAGRAGQVHQELFGLLMDAADLRADYLGYLQQVPAEAMCGLNLMSGFGLHRSLSGASVGHFAATEVTSSPGSARILEGLERLDAPEPCRHFYREHVVADAVHEQVLRHDAVAALIDAEPALEADVVLGIRGFLLTEALLDAHVMKAWNSGMPAIAL